jgi:8-oxo-dGTP pyrophosphatase MutT (NUDIX family)
MIGTSGVIFNDKGEILLLKHRFWKKDSWGLPSGYLKRREKLEDGLKREIKEEAGLTVQIDTLLNLNSGFKLRIECTFIGYCNEEIIPEEINKNEILDAKFYASDNLPAGLVISHKGLIELAIGKQSFREKFKNS